MTTTALWPSRWPLIALQSCIDQVNAVPPDRQAEVKLNLPCDECPEQGACLNAKSKEIGSLMYGREYRTSPRSQEASLFPWEVVEPCTDPSIPLVPYWRKPFSIEERYGLAEAWDVAYSERTGADYLVHLVGYVDRQTNIRHMLDMERWQAVPFDEQIKLIEGKWENWQSDLVVIESDFHQRMWLSKVRQATNVPVAGHEARGKNSMETGMPTLLVQLETKRWVFPWAPGHHHDVAIAFSEELEAFGWVDGKLQGIGEHDDLPMAWYHLAYALDRLSAPKAAIQRSRGVVPGRRL